MLHVIDINNKKINVEIKINLDSITEGRPQYFSLTGWFWEVGKSRTDANLLLGGACGEEIVKFLPNLKIFYSLHCRDVKGCPLYPVDNGFYHGVDTVLNPKADYSQLASYFHIDFETAKILCKATTTQEFYNAITNNDIPTIWQQQANEGIQLLETLTGKTFIPNPNQESYLDRDKSKYGNL